MKKLLGLILFSYFLMGTLLLPQGDFATLPDLPRMYAHCRDTEDHDLTIPDFIEEHLFMMDDLMGELPEPDDKPHQPVQFHHIYAPVTIAVRQNFQVEEPSLHSIREKVPVTDDAYLSDFPASLFRPPIL